MEIKDALVKSEACTEQLSSASCAIASGAATITKGHPIYKERTKMFADSSGRTIKSETLVTSVEAISNWRKDPITIPLRKPTMISTSAKSLITSSPSQRNKKTIRNLIEAERMLTNATGKELTLLGTDGQQTASITKAAMLNSEPGVGDSAISEVFLNDGSTLAGNVKKKISCPARKQRQRQARIGTLVRCTACNNQMGTTFASEAQEHPVLKVLICRKCHKWYNSAEIVRGADGKDEQCRWCSEGGDLICCDFCHNSICKGCIRRNLGRKSLMDILNIGEDAKWACYVCNSTPIFHLIEQCRAVLEALSQNVSKRRVGNIGERIKKKEARQKTNPKLSALPSASEVNSMPPACYLPMFGPGPQTFNNAFASVVGSVSPMANVHQTIARPSANIASAHSIFPDCEARLVATRAGFANSVEVINELMLASGSRLKLLMLLNEELSLAGQRSSSLESMPTLAKERRKIAQRLWATHNTYLHLFRNIVQRLTPTVQSVDMLKNRKALTRNILPRPESQRAPATLSMADARDDTNTTSSSKESILRRINPTFQNSLAESPPAFPLYCDITSVTEATLHGGGTATTENSQSEEQSEILFTNKRDRKRKHPTVLC